MFEGEGYLNQAETCLKLTSTTSRGSKDNPCEVIDFAETIDVTIFGKYFFFYHLRSEHYLYTPILSK